MLITIGTHLGEVLVTLEPRVEGVRTGAKYTWRLEADEAVRVGEGILKAVRLIDEKVVRLRPEEPGT